MPEEGRAAHDGAIAVHHGGAQGRRLQAHAGEEGATEEHRPQDAEQHAVQVVVGHGAGHHRVAELPAPLTLQRLHLEAQLGEGLGHAFRCARGTGGVELDACGVVRQTRQQGASARSLFRRQHLETGEVPGAVRQHRVHFGTGGAEATGLRCLRQHQRAPAAGERQQARGEPAAVLAGERPAPRRTGRDRRRERSHAPPERGAVERGSLPQRQDPVVRAEVQDPRVHVASHLRRSRRRSRYSPRMSAPNTKYTIRPLYSDHTWNEVPKAV